MLIGSLDEDFHTGIIQREESKPKIARAARVSSRHTGSEDSDRVSLELELAVATERFNMGVFRATELG